ncbi:hypothetical protein YB2330_006037 [Saitoella coloradoensis]
MSNEQPPATASLPTLTPALCFHITYLKDFLRYSRASLDDTISAHLNALNKYPAFDPASTSSSTRRPPRILSRAVCYEFLNNTLLPKWNDRDRVYEYCADLAKQAELEEAAAKASIVPANKPRARLDPYGARTLPVEESQLSRVIRFERNSDSIVRDRTWEVLGERCGFLWGRRWEDEMERWRKEKGGQ